MTLIGDCAVSITTISSREFNQDAGGAKRAAEKEPVIITDRSRPSHVLLSFEDYRKLTAAGRSLLDIVGQDEDTTSISIHHARVVIFSGPSISVDLSGRRQCLVGTAEPRSCR